MSQAREIPTLLQVEALSPYRIWVRYSDGEEGEIDLSDVAGKGVFALWHDPGEFAKVHIGPGNAISWNDQVEICPDATYLRMTGKSPDEVFSGLRALRHSA